jgi:hypothetical protein
MQTWHTLLEAWKVSACSTHTPNWAEDCLDCPRAAFYGATKSSNLASFATRNESQSSTNAMRSAASKFVSDGLGGERRKGVSPGYCKFRLG